MPLGLIADLRRETPFRPDPISVAVSPPEGSARRCDPVFRIGIWRIFREDLSEYRLRSQQGSRNACPRSHRGRIHAPIVFPVLRGTDPVNKRRIQSACATLCWIGMLAAAPAAAQVDETVCPSAESTGSGQIFAIEAFDQTWCWEPLPGSPLYRVETKSYRGHWIEEAVVTGNRVTLRRGIGDSTRVRIRACWGSTCSEPSKGSRRVVVFPDFDSDRDGLISGADFGMLRPSLAGSFDLFRAAYGRRVENGRYVEP